MSMDIKDSLVEVASLAEDFDGASTMYDLEILEMLGPYTDDLSMLDLSEVLLDIGLYEREDYADEERQER